MNNGDVRVPVLLAVLAIFVPIMFGFSKNLVEQIACKSECREKQNIIRFNTYSQLYLHCLALFLVFQLLKAAAGSFSLLNAAYLIVFASYVCFEDFKGDKGVVMVLILLFGLVPGTVWVWIGTKSARSKALLDRTYSFYMSLVYLFGWFYLPVIYHPLDNLYELLQRHKELLQRHKDDG